MTGGPWNSKDDRSKDTDINDSNFTGTPLEVTPSRLGEWSTSRRELWGFYLYYVVRFFFCVFSFPSSIIDPKGNNGLSGFNFGPAQFQNLLYLAGYDPSQPPFTKPCGSLSNCVLPYMGRVRNSLSFSRIPHRLRFRCS